jgi:hypothetical protein
LGEETVEGRFFSEFVQDLIISQKEKTLKRKNSIYNIFKKLALVPPNGSVV